MSIDDEREALARIIEDGFEKPDEHHVTADAILAAGFRRSEARHGSCWDAAPQTIRSGVHDPMPTLCELTAGHLGAHRNGMTEWMHRPEPQGEPSDAQRHARARVQARIHEEHAPHFHLGQCKCGAKLGDSIDWNWHLTGVALRAAGGVR